MVIIAKIENSKPVNCDVLLSKLIGVGVTYMYQLRCVVSMFDFYLKLSKRKESSTNQTDFSYEEFHEIWTQSNDRITE